MGKNKEIMEAATESGNKALEIIEKAKDRVVDVVDINDDGKVNMEDAAIVVEAIGKKAQSASVSIKEGLGEKNRELELKILQPIFPDDLNDEDFKMSKFIHVTEMNKKRVNSEVCKGSIGYKSSEKGYNIINIYRDNIDDFGLELCPDEEQDFYYVDPSNRKRYISLDDYFENVKEARIAELQSIAQDLGATHFKVTFKEQKSTFTKKEADVKAGRKKSVVEESEENDNKAGGKKKGIKKSKVVKYQEADELEAERELAATAVKTIEIVAESDFPGQDPVQPKLNYLKKDPAIKALVKMRMNAESPLLHQKYVLKFSTTSGMKEKDAIKIDAVLKAMKLDGNADVASEAKAENRRFFEYEIDFNTEINQQ